MVEGGVTVHLTLTIREVQTVQIAVGLGAVQARADLVAHQSPPEREEVAAEATALLGPGPELGEVLDALAVFLELHVIEAGVGIKAPYFHRSWIRLPWDTDADEMQHRLEASYDIVRSGLTKKLQATLDPRT